VTAFISTYAITTSLATRRASLGVIYTGSATYLSLTTI
ncbi:hypothetical protein CLAFUW4_07796, partial [Fulvia fulva]